MILMAASRIGKLVIGFQLAVGEIITLPTKSDASYR